MSTSVQIVWFRRDLRLDDHPALDAALRAGGPVIPAFILDPETEAIGAAAKWRMGLSIADLQTRLRAMGSELILRRGPALDALRGLAAETGARAVHWTRLYMPEAIARDTDVKAGLQAGGIAAESHPGHLLHEPWTLAPKAGGYFKVFTPFWRTLSARGDVPESLPAPGRVPAPDGWPASDTLASWEMDRAMNRGAEVVARFVQVGEAAAQDRLGAFLEERVAGYADGRDRPDRGGTSRLAENLTYGEISARRVWHSAMRARAEGAQGAESFLREIGWREFAWHLLYHTPHLSTAHWRPEWNAFPWRGDNEDAERWRRAVTGEAMVDAGLREMFVTGTMHNRVRMIVASYLTKHLMTDWRVGCAWFADCLVDWDPASNALGWQWVSGSGPDSAPYFRIFNPETQAGRFDPEGRYRHRFVLGWGDGPPHPDAKAYFDAVPRSWRLDPGAPYPQPMIPLKAGRERALEAYIRHMAKPAAGASASDPGEA